MIRLINGYLLPLIIFALTLVTCLLLLTHQSLFSGLSDNYNYDRARLTRRNPSAIEYDSRSPELSRGSINFGRSRSLGAHSSDINGYINGDGAANQSEIYDQQQNLLLRIEDLKRIKLSVTNELRQIGKEKAKLLKEKTSLTSKNDKLLSQITRNKAQLKQLELDISANRRQKFEQNCDIGQIAPIIFNPMKSVDIDQLSIPTYAQSNSYNSYALEDSDQHRDSSYTFDLSLCPLTKPFKFYLAETNLNIQSTSFNDELFKIEPSLIRQTLLSHPQYTDNINEACLTISLIDQPNTIPDLSPATNNLVINILNSKWYNHSNINSNASIHSNYAIASSVFQRKQFSANLDLILPSIWQSPINYNSILGSIPPHTPLERKYLASYFGQGNPNPTVSNDYNQTSTYELNALERTLQTIHRNSIDDLFLFIYDCGRDSNAQCYEEKEKMIELTTFVIILSPGPHNSIDEYTNDLLYLALSRGAIPVLIGRERVRLPFDEVIDWRRAAILLQTTRLPEIHFILRSISPSDLYLLKYHGRRIFESYLATVKQVLDTAISVISVGRFSYPPPPVPSVKTIQYFQDTDLLFDVNCTSPACSEAKAGSLNGLLLDEILGPREKPFPSRSFRRNFSLTLSSTYDLWNNPMYSAMQLFPSYPLDPVSPSEFKFFNTEQGFRPIGEGLGGSGQEFSLALGGDYPNEQFTVVLLTYERKALLMKTLEKLKGLPFLNKIIVVWNGIQQKPSPGMIWPDVGVPIVVVKPEKNSLNNRFLPYDVIETDAILSLDDDSPLRPDEIVFAFRVWRQSRDRIVGFPGRFHAWDSAQNSWMYNSNHSCELSMVLTGGAFFHKYYSYLYTYSMPEAIRSIVDKFMNCEDIAMNFLVAHLTRKPPIKVTSRWTFHCAGCQSSLSEDDSHFRERHECLNTFASIYGYMPLLSTQHRSDSVLFKTRLPHDKQKCFKFV